MLHAAKLHNRKDGEEKNLEPKLFIQIMIHWGCMPACSGTGNRIIGSLAQAEEPSGGCLRWLLRRGRAPAAPAKGTPAQAAAAEEAACAARQLAGGVPDGAGHRLGRVLQHVGARVGGQVGPGQAGPHGHLAAAEVLVDAGVLVDDEEATPLLAAAAKGRQREQGSLLVLAAHRSLPAGEVGGERHRPGSVSSTYVSRCARAYPLCAKSAMRLVKMSRTFMSSGSVRLT